MFICLLALHHQENAVRVAKSLHKYSRLLRHFGILAYIYMSSGTGCKPRQNLEDLTALSFSSRTRLEFHGKNTTYLVLP